MKWDLVNPWARVHQYLSAHPLTALRISALNRLSYEKGRAAVYPLPEWSRIEWRRFPLEFLLWVAPWAIAFAMVIATGLSQRGLLAVPSSWLALSACVLFGSWLLRILYRYRGHFEPAPIASLISDTVPSGMRPRAVRIEGWIVGRGDPGLFWSPDLLIRDDTGMLFLRDRESVPAGRILLLPGAEEFIGQRVVIEGWYRRDPAPYVEVSRIECADGTERHSWSRWMQAAYAAAGSVALYWFTASSL